ncbi:MAG: cysteinyl-tRNA synthetase [Alphaproteobacteria bacterium]|jgi:cysteinyl-tRNA synthetase
MKIYNTLTKSKVDFKPIHEDEVRMYVCGVTPYDYAHIGNARPAIVFDTLYRFLKAQGKKVTYVRNFTDVDDKIINRASEQGMDWQTLTQNFMRIYHEDIANLNVYSSDDLEKFPHQEKNNMVSNDIIEPLVTDHIAEIIDMIKVLLDKGHAYVAKSGDVIYDTTTFPDYGALSGNTLKDLIAGSRVEVSDDKKNPTDFVLWKSVKPNEPMQWDFNYEGVNAGRPGWHIECSAMSKKNLGETFDIHGGGEDLKFPHHECEIAQSKGSHDGDFANYWMHNAFVNIDGEKMSKSLGNFKTIHGLLEKYSGEALRLWMLSTHYRKPVDMTEEALDEAEEKLGSIYRTLLRFNNSAKTGGEETYKKLPDALIDTSEDGVSFKDEKRYGIDAPFMNDLNTPAAICVLFEDLKLLNKALDTSNFTTAKSHFDTVHYLLKILGLGMQDPEEFLRGGVDIDVDALVKQRDEAKANKDWALSDKIRDDLKAQGIVLEDGPNGTTWRKK